MTSHPPIRLARFHLAYGILSFLIGFALILGGPARASDYAYSMIAHQGGSYVWGTAFAVLGVALITAVNRPMVMRRLLLAGCIAYWVLASAFFLAAILDEEANLTAMIAYGWISSMHWCAYRKCLAAKSQQQ